MQFVQVLPVKAKQIYILYLNPLIIDGIPEGFFNSILAHKISVKYLFLHFKHDHKIVNNEQSK